MAFLLNAVAFPLGNVAAQEALGLPVPGARVALSPAFHPPVLTGVKVYAKDPFRFDFILNKGDGQGDDALRLIKYFLAALTVPEKDLWVNLSPYEKDRIVPEAFGQTEMGRDLLAQDYLLKQITANLMYPEEGLGKKFWDEIYKQAQEKFGTTDIPIDTFNKVWIVPAVAKVYEKPKPAGNNRPEEAVAYVVESRLKVMLESDYLAAKNNTASPTSPSPSWGGDGRGEDLAQALIRTIILPVLEKEVNEGQNFAQLRQVYNSLILAAWYKKKVMGTIQQSPLGFYVGQNKVAGVNIDDPKESEKIWSRYVASFKKGAYNFIREEYDPATQATIPRKYFAGGVNIYPDDMSMVNAIDAAGLPDRKQVLLGVRVNNISKERKPSSLQDNSSLESRSKMPIKVLIFDLGDTLYHSSKVWGRKYQILLELSKADEYSAKEVKDAYLDEKNNKSLSGVVRAFGLNSSAFNAKVDEIDVGGLLKPEQDMIALLKGLKQSYYLVLGSNASDAHVRRVLKALGLDGIFDFICTQENMGVGKPAIAFYEKIQQKVPFPAEAFLSIGASLKDTVPAQKVGMQAILVDGPEDLKSKIQGELDKINRAMADGHKSLAEQELRQVIETTDFKKASFIKGKSFDEIFIVDDPRHPLHHFVVKVSGKGVNIAELREQVKFAKENMGGMIVPFSILENVIVNGSRRAIVMVQEERRVEISFSHYPEAAQASFFRQIRGLIHESVRRQIMLKDWFSAQNMGIDERTQELMFVDIMDPEEGTFEQLFPVFDPSNTWHFMSGQKAGYLDRLFYLRISHGWFPNTIGVDKEESLMGEFGKGERMPVSDIILNRDKGGIDLNPVAKVMQVDASDAGTFFHFDPAMLEKFRDSAGIAPVIINIQPMNDLPDFLGIANGIASKGAG